MANPLESIRDAQNNQIRDSNSDAPSLYAKQTNSVVQDSETKSFLDWYNKLDKSLSAETKDYLVQNYLNRISEERSYKMQNESSSSSYQRAVKDLQLAGLNPFLALSGLSGASSFSGSSSGSVQGGLYSGKQKQSMSTTGTMFGAIIAALALIAVKVLAH